MDPRVGGVDRRVHESFGRRIGGQTGMKPRGHVVVTGDHDLHRRAPMTDESRQVLFGEEFEVLIGLEPGADHRLAGNAPPCHHGADGSPGSVAREKEIPQ